MALCGCPGVWVGAGRSSRHGGTDSPGSWDSRLQDGRPEVFYQPPTSVCSSDFNRRLGCCLRLFALCSFALTRHQSALAARNLVAHHRAAVSRVLLLFPKHNGRAVYRILQNALARIWGYLAAFAARPGFRRFRSRFQAGPDDFLVSAFHSYFRFGLRAKLRNCRGQRRLLSADVYCDRGCQRIRSSLANPADRREVDAISQIVLGSCNCCSTDTCDGARRERAVQQSQALLYRA